MTSPLFPSTAIGPATGPLLPGNHDPSPGLLPPDLYVNPAFTRSVSWIHLTTKENLQKIIRDKELRLYSSTSASSDGVLSHAMAPRGVWFMAPRGFITSPC